MAPHAVGVRAFAVLSAIGGAIGGGLVIPTPRVVLEAAMPWVILAGTAAGGWVGAALALAVDARLLRGTVLAWGGAMSAMFLFHA